MDKQVLIVSLVGGFLGLLGGILGFAAEATKTSLSDYYCDNPASGLAIGASLLLVLAQVIITAFGKCCGCCKQKPTMQAVTDNKRTSVIIFAVISWIMFVVSLILLIDGSVINGTCYVVKSGVFAGGAICALIAVSLSIVAYIISSTPTSDAASTPPVVIQIVQPQLPQPQQQYPPPGTQFPPPGIGGTNYPPPDTKISA